MRNRFTVFDLDKSVYFSAKRSVDQYNILGVAGSIDESKEVVTGHSLFQMKI